MIQMHRSSVAAGLRRYIVLLVKQIAGTDD
jgi:hypothetical protein